MARKPFNLPDAETKFAIGMGVAGQRPKLLQIIGQCVVDWPMVEHHMALLLAVLMRSNTDAGLAMFSTLRQFRAQQEAILVVAQVTQSESDQKVVAAVLDVVRTTQKARDDLAHGNWGISNELPDALLWIEPKFHGPWNAAAVLRDGAHRPTHGDLAKNFFVYAEADLREVSDAIQRVWRIVFDLTVYFRDRGDKLEVDARRMEELRREPLIQEALDRLAKRGNGVQPKAG